MPKNKIFACYTYYLYLYKIFIIICINFCTIIYKLNIKYIKEHIISFNYHLISLVKKLDCYKKILVSGFSTDPGLRRYEPWMDWKWMAPQFGVTSVQKLLYGMLGWCKNVRSLNKERSSCSFKNGGQFPSVGFAKQ